MDEINSNVSFYRFVCYNLIDLSKKDFLVQSTIWLTIYFSIQRIWKLHNIFDINCSNCNSRNFSSNCNCRNHSFASTQFSLRGGHCHHSSLVNYLAPGVIWKKLFHQIILYFHGYLCRPCENQSGFLNL
jgi:hypothetical protein